jgi:hypothetical protein
MRPTIPSVAALASIGALLALAAAAPAATGATNRTVVLNSSSLTVPFQTNVAITGHLTGDRVGGQTVTLSRDPYPFNAHYEPVATVRTAPDGVFTFSRRPGQTAAFRVRSGTAHADLVVRVRYSITMSAATGSPHRGQSVRFSGSVAPGVAGQVVRLQRKSPTGTWATVKTAALVLPVSTETCPPSENQPSDNTGQPTETTPTSPQAVATQTPSDTGTQAPSDSGNQTPSDSGTQNPSDTGNQNCPRQRSGSRTSPQTADKASYTIAAPIFYSGYYRALVYSAAGYVTGWGPTRHLTVVARPS